MNDVSLFDVDVITPNIGLTKPAVGASDDTWGEKLNSNFDIIDNYSGASKTRNDNQDSQIAANTANITAEKNRNDTQDTQIAANTSNIATNTTAIATKVAKAGDTMTGPLGLPADPTTALQAATKQYVDSHAGISDAPSDGTIYGRKNALWVPAGGGGGGAAVYVSDTPPAGAADGSLWWESDSGNLFIRYNDGDSSQWVIVSPQIGGGVFVSKAGDTMTGPLVLSADPATAMQAATQQYTNRLYNVDLPAAGLTAAQQQRARQNIYAAPFDVMASANIIINGGMEVTQEFTGGTNVNVPNGPQVYITDQFSCIRNHAANTAAFVAFQGVGGMPVGWNYLNFTATTALTAPAAGDFAAIMAAIEGTRVERLNFGGGTNPFTVNFWAYSNISGTAVFSLRNNASDRSYCVPFNVVAGTWTYNSILINSDATGTWLRDSGVGLRLCWSFACGSTYQAPAANAWQAGNYFSLAGQTNFFATNGNFVGLAGVSMLMGTDAPPQSNAYKLNRPYAEELQLCQRYYEASGGMGTMFSGNVTSGQSYFSYAPFKVTKRASPVITLTNWTSTSFPATGTVGTIDPNGFYETRAANATGTGTFGSQYKANARL